jgi:hypothetical protein
MKKKILFLSIALISFTAFGFAADAPSISKNVMSSFNREFSNARDIQWENKADFLKAQFTINEKVLFAYFNKSGELIAVTRFISPKELPAQLLTSLKKEFSGYWISDLFEIQTESGTDHYATLENADHIMVLKSESNGNWIIFQTENKGNGE